MKIEVLIADYLREQHSQDIGYLLNNYAADPMGDGAPLSDFIQQNLALELSKVPNAFSVICYVDDKPKVDPLVETII